MTRDDPFHGFRTPRAPDDLKRRILEASATVGEPTIWDQLWQPRLARAAWAVVTAALIVAHVALGVPYAPQETAGVAATERAAREVKEELDLPSIEISPRVEALFKGPPTTPSEVSEPRGNHSASDEVQG